MTAMFKPVELFVGLRYTRSKRRNRLISLISFISILTIALGVMVLITVMSVFNGFEKEVRVRILDMISHMTVSSIDGRLKDWENVAKRTIQHPNVNAAAPYIEGEGMLIYAQNVHGVMIRGIEPRLEAGVSKVAEKMKIGKLSDLKPGEYGIVLGKDLARKLGVDVGEKITMVTPSASITLAGVMPRMKRFKVIGIFAVNMFLYDSSIGLIHMKDADKLFRKNNTVTGVRLELDDVLSADLIKDELYKDYVTGYWIRSWRDYHSNWFHAVKNEKRMVSVLIVLVIMVAVVNIISTLTMVVTEKQSDIAILRTLGASPGSILSIFVVQGTIIGLFGTAIGVVAGLLLADNIGQIVSTIESMVGVRMLDPSVYFISQLPSDIRKSDVVNVATIAFVLSILATLIPARRASKTQPAEALRYE